MNITGFIEKLMTSAYDSSGYSSGQSQVVTSFTKSSTQEDIDGSSVLNTNQQLKLSLEDFWISELITSIYSSALTDIIKGSKFEIKLDESIDDHESKTKELNNFLNEIELDSNIINILPKSLYWGSYSWYIDYKTNKLIELNKPYDLVQVKLRGVPHKYIIKSEGTGSSENSDKFTDSESNIVSADKIINLNFDPIKLKSVTYTVKDEDHDKDSNTQEDLFLKKNSVKYSYYSAKGICDDILLLLAEYLIKYMLQYLLSLKINLRQDVLISRLNEKSANTKDITETIQAIEDCLNNTDSDISIFNLDISRILYQAQSVLSSSIKVVPGLPNYSDYQLLEYPDWQSKLERLNSDLENIMKTILGIKGIPPEMVDGSSSNRWESIQRSSRLMSSIEDKLTSITNLVRGTIKSYYNHKYGHKISDDKINFNIDSSNIIFNTVYNSKIETLANKTDNVSRILTNYDNMISSDKLNLSKLNDWFKTQISSIDPVLSESILDVDYEKSNINDKSDEEFEESL